MDRLERGTSMVFGQKVVPSTKLSFVQRALAFLCNWAATSKQRAADAPYLHPRCCRADRGFGGTH